MKGSEKQIKWAQDIIDSAYRALECLENNYSIHRATDETDAQVLDRLHYDLDDVKAVRKEIEEGLKLIDNASIIIDHRDRFTQRNIQNQCQEHHRFFAKEK